MFQVLDMNTLQYTTVLLLYGHCIEPWWNHWRWTVGPFDIASLRYLTGHLHTGFHFICSCALGKFRNWFNYIVWIAHIVISAFSGSVKTPCQFWYVWRRLENPLFHTCVSQEQDGPFPWAKSSGGGSSLVDGAQLPQNDPRENDVTMEENNTSHVFSLHGECPVHDIQHMDRPDPSRKAASDSGHQSSEDIVFQLPCSGALAGTVLRHSIKIVEQLFEKHAPMTFKFGITHNADWRWGNKMYGYRTAPEKWRQMVILYQSNEPYSVGMLEAALIEKYESIWIALDGSVFVSMVWNSYFVQCSPKPFSLVWNP